MAKMVKSGKMDAGSSGGLKVGSKKGEEKPPTKKEPVDRGERMKGKMPMRKGK
jgi:hypothetical protein